MLKEIPAITKPAIKSVRNTAIIGLNRSGIRAYNRIKEQQSDREKLVGIIDVNNRKIPHYNGWQEVKYLGTLRDFPHLKSLHNINHFLIAVHPDDISQVHEIVSLCRTHGIEYQFASEVQDVIYGHTVQQIFKDLQRPWEPNPRQVLDSFLAFILMMMLLPLFIVMSILIKLDSAGPVLYSQERVGKKGRIFRIFKFRTMYIDAERMTGPVLAKKNDPRITKMGRFIRKIRIDEIPQLLNVVIGDMSFIGPRPERPYFVDKYTHEIPMYKKRLHLKPGITGLAQVYAGYDEDLEDVRNKLSYDLTYVENYRSLSLNLSIIFKTIMVVFTGKGQ